MEELIHKAALLYRNAFESIPPETILSWLPPKSMKKQMSYLYGWPARPEPRHSMARFSIPGVGYSYKGKEKPLSAIPSELLPYLQLASSMARVDFNCVVVNSYIGGVGLYPHRDSKYIPELGEMPSIMSFSFGEPRTFRLHRLCDKGKKRLDCIDCLLSGGDALLMQGECDIKWHHSMPEEADRPGLRVSLTFRRHEKA